MHMSKTITENRIFKHNGKKGSITPSIINTQIKMSDIKVKFQK